MSSSSSRVNLETCRIPLEEIIRATKNFSPETQVGDGGFGMVYRGQLSEQWENHSVAIKRLHPNGYQGNTEFYNELEMVKTFKHPNIIPFIGYCDDANEKIVVYEYATNISLDHHLQNPYKRRCLTWTQRLKICLGAARGLKYLHSGVGEHRRVIHRDMKSANILLDDNLVAKICDFGLSRFSPRNQQDTGVCTRASGTKFYIDPVYNERGRLTKESDIYSFGVVMFEMSTGTMAYDARRFEEANDQYLIGIVRSTYEEHENVTGLDKLMDPAIRGRTDVSSFRKFNEIAYKCIDLDIKKRPTMDRIIEGIEEALNIQLSFCTMKNTKFQLENFLDAFYIPDYILDPNKEVNVPLVGPSCPTIVFIHSKSGGQLGNDLLVIYRSFLNENQVFDLVEEAPDRVLRKLYLNITTLKHNGDTFAAMIEKNLRIIVAGGDGTAGWLLGVVSDLKLSHPPPIATMPLGTENNLPFAFGWGKKNPGTDHESVLNFLEQVMSGKQMQIDSWHILLRMKSAPKVGSHDPIAPLELPHSLHAFSRVSDTDELNVSGYDTFRGGFCDYFSMGMDAQLSYASHCERKLHPEKLKNPLTNQLKSKHVMYYTAKIASPQGWFATSRFFPSSKNIAQLMKVKVMQRHGDWKDLKIHHNIRSILCLNLPSFSGGQNPWGTPNQNKSRDRDLTPPYVDDGILEIVGFKDAWQGVPLLASKGHVIRLAQTHGVRFEFHKGAADCTYMSMDGEPWKQPLPVEKDDTVVVEISHLGKVKMLATQNCISKSVYDPSTPLSNEQEADSDSENEDGSSSGEKVRKFGAADTFKIPEDVDISRLS